MLRQKEPGTETQESGKEHMENPGETDRCQHREGKGEGKKPDMKWEIDKGARNRKVGWE
jgi:hypothetical protein